MHSSREKEPLFGRTIRFAKRSRRIQRSDAGSMRYYRSGIKETVENVLEDSRTSSNDERSPCTVSETHSAGKTEDFVGETGSQVAL